MQLINQSVDLDGTSFEIHTAEAADVASLPFDKEVRQGKRRAAYYTGDFGCFDIETTSVCLERDKYGRFLSGFGFMYIWQFYSESTGLVMGRYWSDFVVLLRRIAEHYNASEDERRYFVIYVHNLPFEFAFMADQLTAAGFKMEVFAVKSRKPIQLRLTNGAIEFRCSLKLTNRGLAKYLSDMKAGFHKMSGDLDYRVQRTPKTILTPQELGYCAADVIGLYYALRKDMMRTDDTIATVPLTSTGYVRRDERRWMKGDKQFKQLLSSGALTVRQYRMTKRLAKGGDTLGALSQEYGAIILKVGSADFVSDYPAQLLIEPYPMGKLEYEGRGSQINLVRLDEIEEEGRYFITEFKVIRLRLKDKLTPIPCVTLSKVDAITGHPIVYNGRLLKLLDSVSRDQDGAETRTEGAAYMAMDMISFRLFREQYDFDAIYFGYTYSCIYEPLPENLRRFILEYFRGKCELKMKLKGMTEGTKEYEETDLDYGLYKNRFNGIFGMFYTDPMHEEIGYDFEGGKGWTEEPFYWTEEEMKHYHPEMPEAEIKERLEAQRVKLWQNQAQASGLYLWGVHTAALGRYKLDRLIRAVGYRNAIYSDTDSVKFKYNEEALAGLAKLNEWLTKKAIDAGAYQEINGKRFLLGIAEDETAKSGPYEKFVTLGAKKYCYEDQKGLHLTLSGVRKSEVVQLKGDIRNFKKGFVFSPAGGIMLHYIDAPMREVTVYGDDGTEDTITLGNSIYCEERTITVGGIRDERENMELAEWEEICSWVSND